MSSTERLVSAARPPAGKAREDVSAPARPTAGVPPPARVDGLRIGSGPAPVHEALRPEAAARAEAEFHSILFPGPAPAPAAETDRAPAFFRDLHLDQIIEAVTARKQEYDLGGFFLRPLRDVEILEHRHEVMRELQRPSVLERIRAFATELRAMRNQLATAEKLYYKEQKQAWFVDAVEIYCRAVARLADDLDGVRLRSAGFAALRRYLRRYVASDQFTALRAETSQLKEGLSEVRYCFVIKDARVLVRRYEDEPDYSADVAATFARFAQGAAKSYLVEFSEYTEMNHVEAAILNRVARLHPAVFAELTEYCERHRDYCDRKIAEFDREIQFYISYLDFIAPLRQADLQFCFPRLSRTSKAVRACATFDLALAAQLVRDGKAVVCNDFHLENKERIFVVSGPNQGGKTTFARTFGQLHYLASLGLPVPGRQAQLFLCDRIFSHFSREEHVLDLRGKLEDDLLRIQGILAHASGDSALILNEIFTSTTLHDALSLSRKVLGRIIRLDALCVCVTFIDELASLGEQTVSMVSTVVPDNPAERTYKVVRRPADGLAYAMTIAEKHGLTYDCITRRVPT